MSTGIVMCFIQFVPFVDRVIVINMFKFSGSYNTLQIHMLILVEIEL